MNRRAFLAAATTGSLAAVGGLGAGVLEPGPETAEPTHVGTVLETAVALDEGPFRELRADTLPASYPIEATATFLRQPDGNDPALVRVSLANDGALPKTLRTSTLGLPFPNGSARAADGSGLVLAPARTDFGDGSCPRGWPVGKDAVDERRVSGRDALEETYAVFNHPDNERCYPPGEYHFSQSYTVNPGPWETSAFEWGFALVV